MNKKQQLGQYFTNDRIVNQAIKLIHNQGNILEPSAGDGRFLSKLPASTVGIELDTQYQASNVLNMDFFDYNQKKFDTIIGNPPYVKYSQIYPTTKSKLPDGFDKRTNLSAFFIKHALSLLKKDGELIFIVPHETFLATSNKSLIDYMYNHGTITDYVDLGDNVFDDATPNTILFRYQLGDFDHQTRFWDDIKLKHYDVLDSINNNGILYFSKSKTNHTISDYFSIYVGAVSGADKIFENPKGNAKFVNSKTRSTGKLKTMFYNKFDDCLLQYKQKLINRKVNKVDPNLWWNWGRGCHIAEGYRIYVNQKTRTANPFFVSKDKYYDGSILGIFPKTKMSNSELDKWCLKLNSLNWEQLGLFTDGRYLFTQRTLANCPI